MIGSFLTRGLVMVFGYAYPAYECYKTIEMNKPDIEKLLFWCQYWILVAVLTVCERVGDTFISWVPMYSEAKLAFFLYLWCPKTKGTTYVYNCFFKPVVSNHEAEIDRNLLELRTRAEDLAVLSWQKSASYIQTRIFDVLQYIASQSSPRQAAPPQQQDARVRQPPAVPNRKPAVVKKQPEQPPSTSSTSSSSQDQEDAEDESGPSQPPKEDLSAATANAQRTPTKALIESSKSSKPNEAEVMQIDPSSSSVDESAKLPAPETIMEEGIRVTRASLRRTRTAPNTSVE